MSRALAVHLHLRNELSRQVSHIFTQESQEFFVFCRSPKHFLSSVEICTSKMSGTIFLTLQAVSPPYKNLYTLKILEYVSFRALLAFIFRALKNSYPPVGNVADSK